MFWSEDPVTTFGEEAVMKWSTQSAASVLILLACGMLVACGGRDWRPPGYGDTVEDKVSGCTAPAFPTVEGEGPFVYVAECGGGGNGSKENPYSSLAEALKNASDGTTVVLAEGTYQGEVTLSHDINLVGAGPGLTFIEATLDAPVITLHMANFLRLEGFTIKGDAPYGLYLNNSAMVTINNVEITEVGDEGKGAAIMLDGGNNIQIGTPFAGLPGEGEADVLIHNITGMGVYGEETILAMGKTRIEGAPKGGLYMLNSRSIGQRYETPTISAIAGNVFANCGLFGVHIEGGKVNFSENLVEGTVAGDEYSLAHCLTVTESEEGLAEVFILDNELVDCQGAGMLLQGLTLSPVERNTIRGASNGGVWTQMECQAHLNHNVIEESSVVGIALAEGSISTLDGNTVSGITKGGMYEFTGGEDLQYAFGILVRGTRSAGHVSLANNIVTGCEFAGILLHDTNTNELTFGQGNVVAGNIEAGIALEAESEPIAGEQDLENLVSFSHAEAGLDGNGPTGSENVVLGTTYLPQ